MSSYPASYAALAAASTGASVTSTAAPTAAATATATAATGAQSSSPENDGSFVVNLKYGKTVAPFPVPSLSTTLSELRTMMQADPSMLGSPAGEELAQAPFKFEYDDVRGNSTQRVFRSHEHNVRMEEIPGNVIHLVYDKDAGLAMMEEIEAKAAAAAAAASAAAGGGSSGNGKRYKQTPTRKKRGRPSASASASASNKKKAKAPPKQPGGEIYTVEDIVDRRKIDRKGKRGRKPAKADKDLPNSYRYRVRWVGYPPEEDTWEPLSNLGHDMKQLVKDRWWPDGVGANVGVPTTTTTTTSTSQKLPAAAAAPADATAPAAQQEEAPAAADDAVADDSEPAPPPPSATI
mmetsp:Transcript_31417/g.76013  ORF Transcript_31417/g.76013 Transcript_31417/m.76013 type:complete len:348 (+) Transcript_31417:309-1352(+)|eukprot:CAMPEP_0113463032 /NCGR_PEP_ID=MMETSP0014_2-20120614/12426_1 /TAXON_ID=2857 /ORGANISM="Nitzschia sp." /LENGTH=347 /DNA_ID=CAMNT_0000354969 /DNA_START=249 /DNA_END=1292 /DNA_ORIENTATION=+ /assembly_acc=CAM_ASM_000159